MRIRVECYSGYRGDETPRRIWMANKKIEVKDILDQWIAPDHRYFKIQGDDKTVYILRHDSTSWDWEMVFFHMQNAHLDWT